MEKFLPKKAEKEVISMRIPSYVLQEVDRKASQFDISRNEFINQCITFALSHMDDAPVRPPGRGRAGHKKEE